MTKAQSAIEFLSTYAFAFLIIGVALALLFVFSTIPQTYLPTVCSFYNGFSQSCDAIYYNTTNGANLTVIATDATPGVINVSSFSAYINFGTSTAGTCSPTVALAGQTIYCTANLAQKPHLGTIYTGTFNVKANYCANAPSNISNSTCPSSTAFYYSGQIRVQAAPYRYSGIFFVPITITNSQTTAAQGPFQQMIQFVPNDYVSHENGNLGNIRFYYGNRELASWCESNCTNSSTHLATFWIKLPSGIPASSSAVVNMYILPKSVNYDGSYAGEAPQLSPSYAKYDNGANVFNFYDDFNGTSLSPKWVVKGVSYTVSNSIAITSVGGPSNSIYATASFSPPAAFDAYSQLQVASWGDGQLGALAGSQLPALAGAYLYGWSGAASTPIIEAVANNAGTETVTNYATGAFHVYSVIYTSSNVVSEQDYASQYSVNSGVPSVALNPQIVVGSGGSGSTSNQATKWYRVRSYPPNNVMPSTSFGLITQLQ
ncbi:MAG: hypothetical protein KGH60_00585 [Candidatus Micrarchaeota archaeon]|nr:hypothetical protein [Candidatus Micrarchaeota archaeon]